LRQAMEGSGMEIPERSKKSRKRRKKRRRAEQEAIFSRTLQQHAGNE
jgi:hypothetical protein